MKHVELLLKLKITRINQSTCQTMPVNLNLNFGRKFKSNLLGRNKLCSSLQQQHSWSDCQCYVVKQSARLTLAHCGSVVQTASVELLVVIY